MASPPPGFRDRLSDLPDALLGHILSFLPNKEAGCAATLSRRWRDIFCNVHTISFEEEDGERANDQDTYYYDDVEERKSRSAALLDGVCSALLCRRRCAGHHVPLRFFRFAFDKCHRWNFVHVDQWLSYVLRHSSQELNLDLRFRISRADDDHGYKGSRKKGEVDSGSDNSDDEDSCKKREADSRWMWPDVRRKTLSDDDTPYVLPRRLFRCTVIRTLSVAYCRLKLPAAVNLPFLETLSITGTRHDGGRSIQRLIASCPRLADLTLEAIRHLTRVSVLDKRLRRFALRCCHNVKSVEIDVSELVSLDYCGTVPAELLLSLHGSPGIPSCTFDFCRAHSKQAEFDGFRMFMEKFSDTTKYMQLHHGRLESRFFLGFPSFTSLTWLALQGPVWTCGTVVAVGRVLEQTPNLEVLSLYMDEEEEDIEEDEDDDARYEEDEYGNVVMDKEKDAVSDELTVPDVSSFSVPCLRHRVKEINMVHYNGSETQRMMAKLLFCNALVLERMCVVLVVGTFAWQSKLKKEIESWMAVAHAHKSFL